MIKNFNNKKNRVCLGLVLSVCLLAHGKSSASGSSELDDATRRHRNNIASGQGALSGNNITGPVEQNFNKGGEGGRAEVHNHNHIGGAPLSPKTPAEYYNDGLRYRREVPPREDEAMLAFEQAASVMPNPHINACIICAEHFSKLLDIKESSKHYINALKALKAQGNLEDGDTDCIYSGLMKLYYEGAIRATNKLMKKDYFNKAHEYRKKIGTLNTEEEYSIVDDLNDKLSSLEIKPISSVDSMVNSLKKESIISSSVTSISDLTIPPSSDNKKANRILEAKAEAERIIAEAEEEAEYNRTISEAKIKAEEIKTKAKTKIKAEEIKTKAKTKIIFDDKVSSETKTITRSYPAIARGYEAIYDRFMNGRLVYKGPAGERSFLISDIANSSLEGEFNLNGLTFTSGSKTYNISDYLRIKLGYRKVKENEDKTTAWIVPQFVSRAGDSSFNAVQWTSDVGIFWTWGKYGLTDFDYLTSMQFDKISTQNLYDLVCVDGAAAACREGGGTRARASEHVSAVDELVM